MKIIQTLSEKIEDEIKDATCYAKLALEQRDERPKLAEALYMIANEEMAHMNRLHDNVALIIKEYRETNGEPPESMKAVYDYLHKRQIEKAKEAKTLLAMYRER